MPPLTSRVLPAGVLAGSPQPTLPTGDGLLLRPWRDGDVPAVHRAYQDPALHRWHLRAAAGADEVRGWVEDWRAQWAAERGVQFAVADEDSGRLLGRVALRSLALGDGMAEVAYWTVTEPRGRAGRRPSPFHPGGHQALRAAPHGRLARHAPACPGARRLTAAGR